MERSAYSFELKDEDNKNPNDCEEISKQGITKICLEKGIKRKGDEYQRREDIKEAALIHLPHAEMSTKVTSSHSWD